MARQLTQVIAGFIPLLDSAVLVIASEMGFAEQEGIELKLVRETSWANIRDRIAVGHFDVAHMLAPMPIASSLNLTSLAVPMKAPMLLGLGGNAITVSRAVWSEMEAKGADESGDPVSTGNALSTVISDRKAAGKPPLHFGIVHPFSGHAYELRYWLAAAGIDPDGDVEITVLAPQLMADALATGQLDGYCVGEPWNTASVLAETGRIVTYKQAIWPNSPEKVLGVTQAWAEKNADLLASLMRAISAAANWCAEKGNHFELARLLSGPGLLEGPLELCLPALSGNLRLDQGTERRIPDFLTFAGGERAMPTKAHGVWFYEQMVRWGQATRSAKGLALVEQVYSPERYRAALNLPMPSQMPKIRLFDTPGD
ncbi:MAG: ABC transporter substrate-binding protein [Roseibium sp.]|uniref:CmpA/NrtA family ABC transporter substrate-binding protein n=1 Tax=Roseibium sp. TaxID=1936156 RepID=UPI002626B164|nr:CmpA/NrtA family ABC transporter substrate-binding protein [Roseibium sp.]MCV0426768.1 ABC transporter substrate-binding protein [Roseibium sp.]